MNRRSIPVTLLAIIVTLAWVIPLFWMIKTSVTSRSEIFSPDLRWMPSSITFEHYEYLIERAQILRWAVNSLVVTFITTSVMLVVAPMAAYPLSRMRFPFRNVLFYITLAGIIVPPEVVMIPRYLLLKNMHLLNTYLALILPSLSFPISVIILTRYFAAIPEEYEEAARVDGASRFTILFRIIMPMAKPALVVVAVLTFVRTWNDFLWPLVAVSRSEMYTLPVGLATFQGAYDIQYGATMAAAVMASLPMWVFFLVFHRYMIEGLTVGGLKG